jgi:putative membrane protein
MTDFVPYCGLAPIPGNVSWNLDPVLGAFLLASLAICWRAMPPRFNRGETFCLFAGWAILALALLSPLCNMSVALFSARAAQHIVIVFIAAPLIALSRVPSAMLPRLGGHSAAFLSPAAFVFAAVFWFWHFSYPYDLSLQNNFVYWLMQVSIILSSIALWAALVEEIASGGIQFLAGSVFTGIQMSLLGALLTFSGSPWFSVHFTTTAPWGFAPLEDQQFGGALMWTVGGLILAGFVLYRIARLLVSPEAAKAS